MPVPLKPFIRVITINFDGGAMTLDCLRSLDAVEWPKDRLEIVMVDNASVDGIVDRVRSQFPHVRVIEPFANLGFSGGCNVGIRAPGAWDYVALINNDATVEPDWLAPLVETLESDPHIGAGSPKMLFDGRFRGLRIDADTDEPNARTIRMTGLRAASGEDVSSSASFDEGVGINLHETRFDRWMRPHAEVRWRSSDAGRSPSVVEIELSAPVERTVRLSTPEHVQTVTVGPTPVWFCVSLDHEPFDVVNNAGSNLFTGGRGGDRGFLERDRGQYDEPADIFAWCGGAVLLRRAYLDDVGLFDERFFLYYEDTDLAWRGRLAGWRYVYVPNSTVRHRHAASSGGEGAALFRFYVQRNRLLMLVRSAPVSLVVRAVGGDVFRVGWAVRSAVAPLKHGRRPSFRAVREQCRALASFAKVAPAVARDRLRGRPVVDRASLLSWMVHK